MMRYGSIATTRNIIIPATMSTVEDVVNKCILWQEYGILRSFSAYSGLAIFRRRRRRVPAICEQERGANRWIDVFVIMERHDLPKSAAETLSGNLLAAINYRPSFPRTQKMALINLSCPSPEIDALKFRSPPFFFFFPPSRFQKSVINFGHHLTGSSASSLAAQLSCANAMELATLQLLLVAVFKFVIILRGNWPEPAKTSSSSDTEPVRTERLSELGELGQVHERQVQWNSYYQQKLVFFRRGVQRINRLPEHTDGSQR